MEQYYNSWLVARFINGKDKSGDMEYRTGTDRQIMGFPSFEMAMVHMQMVTQQTFDEIYSEYEIMQENNRYVN